ncbi:hypothetical protein J8273_1872 [Carpediemonas membranifera]|uniref:Uncharacterized protein n=1 Tax=Carpediemonas membranifera TaxID=201153 RepID=A0A8J6B974_9EUKA|nr:hypothetical protein J8273_1872 [Carpediemonas membranifera]|eukprot:KAG9396829.1 hypothetical protein J8273_1872 [Carpediemonas membranifera]
MWADAAVFDIDYVITNANEMQDNIDDLFCLVDCYYRKNKIEAMKETLEQIKAKLPSTKKNEYALYAALAHLDTDARDDALNDLETEEAIRELILTIDNKDTRLKKLSDYLMSHSDDIIAWSAFAREYLAANLREEARFCFQQILLARPTCWGAALGISTCATGDDTASYALLARRLCEVTDHPLVVRVMAKAQGDEGALVRNYAKGIKQE